MRPLLASALVLAFAALLAASARPATSPTVAACAEKWTHIPHHPGRIATIMNCLSPKSIVVTGALSWTDCPSAPPGDTCDKGVVTVSFHSTAAGFQLAPGLVQPEPWGGTLGSVTGVLTGPFWSAFGLPGTGSFHCEARQVDQATNSESLDYSRTIPLRDQGAGFAVVGSAIRVSTSLYPGMRGPYGHNADRLFAAATCRLPAFRPSAAAARGLWPGKLVPAGSLLGASPVVRISGTQKHTIPAPNGSWFGTRIDLTYRWSATVILRPAT
jgi:hypothetical protein